MIQQLKQAKPTAKKEHVCEFCNGRIAVGQKYSRDTYVYDSMVYDWVAHIECCSVASKLSMYDNCDDNGLGEDIFRAELDNYVYANHFDEELDDIAEYWQLSYYELVKKILDELEKEGETI